MLAPLTVPRQKTKSKQRYPRFSNSGLPQISARAWSAAKLKPAGSGSSTQSPPARKPPRFTIPPGVPPASRDPGGVEESSRSRSVVIPGPNTRPGRSGRSRQNDISVQADWTRPGGRLSTVLPSKSVETGGSELQTSCFLLWRRSHRRIAHDPVPYKLLLPSWQQRRTAGDCGRDWTLRESGPPGW